MKFQFDPNLDFQHEAINAVVDLFDGQEVCQTNFTVVPLKHDPQTALPGMENDLGTGNRLRLLEEDIQKNVKDIQLRNGLAPSEAPGSMNFTVEMETGTGKTYVYLRTILEMNRLYGFTKFIIVVPSVAIKEGVYKSLQMTEAHFKGLYENVQFDYFVYDSQKLGQVRNFATSDYIQIMVINIDAFRKSFTDPDKEDKANIIHRPHDRMTGNRPIEFIQATKPIVIIDEPQSVDTTSKSKEAIASLNPLYTLRYSATHVDKYHMMYKLDSVDAYQRKLVKQIEVSGIEVKVKCGMILEDILKSSLNNLYNNPRGAHYKKIIRQSYSQNKKLTLGKLLINLKKTNAFKLLSDAYKIDIRKLNNIDFDLMVRIRNEAAHERRNDLEDGVDADAYIMYGYLLKLLNILAPVLNASPNVPQIKPADLKPAKVVRRPKKRTIIPIMGVDDKNDESIQKDTIEVNKNKRTGKFFIFLEKVSTSESNYIIPDGKIKVLSSDLFDKVEVFKKKFLLSNKLITPEQSERLEFYEKDLKSSKIDRPISKRDSNGEPGYIKKYRKMIESPNTVPSIMLKCIKSAGTIRWKDLKRMLIEKYNYKESGSFGASLRVLAIDGHINIDGSGDEKLIS